MFSIIYFCRDNSRSGSDSSMHASLRMSKRAGGGAAQGESRLSSAGEGRLPAPIPLGSGLHGSVRAHLLAKWGQGKSSEKFLEAAGFPTFACSSLKALFQLPCHFGTWGRFYLQIAAGSGRGQTRGRRRRTMVTGRRVEIPSAGARSRRLASPPGGDGHSPREATRVAPLPRLPREQTET